MLNKDRYEQLGRGGQVSNLKSFSLALAMYNWYKDDKFVADVSGSPVMYSGRYHDCAVFVTHEKPNVMYANGKCGPCAYLLYLASNFGNTHLAEFAMYVRVPIKQISNYTLYNPETFPDSLIFHHPIKHSLAPDTEGKILEDTINRLTKDFLVHRLGLLKCQDENVYKLSPPVGNKGPARTVLDIFNNVGG